MKALIAALMMVESGGDATAIGDGGAAVGVLQIHPAIVQDLNRWGYAFKLVDRLDPVKSVRMAEIWLTRWCGSGASYEKLARCWNGGPRGYAKASTLAYWKKVRLELKRQGIERLLALPAGGGKI